MNDPNKRIDIDKSSVSKDFSYFLVQMNHFLFQFLVTEFESRVAPETSGSESSEGTNVQLCAEKVCEAS